MKKYRVPVSPKADALASIHCDRCDKSMATAESVEGVWTHEGASFKLSFGYSSRFDMQTWEFDLCDACAEKMKALFMLRPAPDTNATVAL